MKTIIGKFHQNPMGKVGGAAKTKLLLIKRLKLIKGGGGEGALKPNSKPDCKKG